MKRYITPRLIEIGTVNVHTQGVLEGGAETDNTRAFPMGTVGFNL